LLYRPLSAFLVRAPALPLATFGSDEEPAGGLLSEAVAVASPAVTDSRGSADGDPRREQRLRRTLTRYRTRMSTRSTPFGLFAGVATGTLGSPTCLTMGPVEQWRKRSRPDMEWLLRLVKDWERTEAIAGGLRVRPHPAAYRQGSRFVLPYASSWADPDARAEKRANLTVRATRPAVLALQLAVDEPTVDELVAAICRAQPGAPESRVRQLVAGLVANEVLVTELVPPANSPDALEHVLQKLRAIPGAAAEHAALSEVRELLAAYDACVPGQGEARLAAARATMSALAPAAHCVQVDLAFAGAQVSLPDTVGEEIAATADCIMRLTSQPTGLAHLRSYHAAFLEHYGAGREVAVLEALSDEVGIGPPDTYSYPFGDAPPPARPSTAETPWRTVVRLALAAQLLGRQEFEVTPALIEELAPALDPAEVPFALELFAELVTESTQALDQGAFDLVLSPIMASFGAGRAFGRFNTLLKPDLEQAYLDHFRREEAHRAPTVFAELAHLPPAGRLANVSMVPNWRLHQLAVGGFGSGEATRLELADVTVYACQRGLHLRVNGKDLVVTATQMVNVDLLPNVCRFLLEVSIEGVRLPGSVNWDNSLALPRLPRIRYGRTVLAPQTWQIAATDPLARLAGRDEWRPAFQAWCDSFEVPRFVQLVNDDRRLLLDLTVPDHAEEIQRQVRTAGSATLLERLGGLDAAALDGPNGARHVLEGVFPVELAGSTGGGHHHPAGRVAERLPDVERQHGPGSNWLYLRLYGSRHRQDELLADHVLPLAHSALDEGLCTSWFYLRYADPRPHLRLRFFGEPASLLALLGRTEAWARGLRTEAILRSVEVGTYEQEIERYGGPELMAPAEAVFAADSTLCARFLASSRARRLTLDSRSMAALACLDLMDRVPGLPPAGPRPIAASLAAGLLTRELRSLAAALWLPADRLAVDSADAQAVRTLLTERAPALAGYRAAVERQPAPVALPEILSSFLHMHCNRILADPSPEAEDTVLALAVKLHRWRAAMHRAGQVG